jgi:tryptophan synthase alpha chain
MNRIDVCFSRLKQQQRQALITFITAGDPAPSATLPLMHALVAAGADIIELGIPFSDPMADGPVIQRASERALAHGISLSTVLAMVSEFRQQNTTTPVVLMGYLNPIEIMGYEYFAQTAQAAGVDGVLTVDLPPEEAETTLKILRQHHIAPIFLIAPTTTPTRMEKLCAQAQGFIYYVAVKGVTGSAALDVSAVAAKVTQIRTYTDLPVGVGFGIKAPSSAAQVAAVSDAVVVGSALVSMVEQDPDNALVHIPALVAQMRQAIDG